MIIFGIWVHKSKPPMVFFEKIFDQISKLQKKKIVIFNNQFEIRCHAGLFDLPAKAMILRTKQWNGNFGCVCCFHPGRRIGFTTVYTINSDRNANPEYPLKTNEDYVEYSKVASDLNKDINDLSKMKSIFGYISKSPIDHILKIPDQIPFAFGSSRSRKMAF